MDFQDNNKFLKLKSEWESKKILIAIPYAKNLWQEFLAPAQKEVIKLIENLCDKIEVTVICPDREYLQNILGEELVQNIKILTLNYGDIWLRDISGFCLYSENQIENALSFKWNGWGNKYFFAADEAFSKNLYKNLMINHHTDDRLIVEGGAVEFNGIDTIMLTKENILNKNRNPNYSQEKIENILSEKFFVTNFIWLNRGLHNDHTDGHIDNIARFIANDHILAMYPSKKDPHEDIIKEIKNHLLTNYGDKYNISFISSPGEVKIDNMIVPASHMNFVQTEKYIIMPSYNYSSQSKENAIRAKEELENISKKKVILLPSDNILSGGGSFHCLSFNC